MLEQIILYTIIAIFIGISQSAGVGGGPVLNICLMIGAGYSTKQSMSITYVFLMGGSIASIIKNYGKLQQGHNLFIVNYDLIIITLPMIASGSLFGTLSNHYLSQFVVTILFVILLAYLSFNTYNKLKSDNQSNGQKKSPLLPHYSQVQMTQIKTQTNPELEQILKQQLNPLPKFKLLIVLIVFCYTIGTLLLKGGHHYDSLIGLPQCGSVGNLLVFCHLGLSYYISKKMGANIIQKEMKKQSLGYIFQNQNDKMNEKKIWSSILSGFAAGLIGGALGLGGVIVLIPVWLNLGIDKQKVVSTSPPLVFFSSFVSFTICALSGRYKSFMQISFYFGLAYIGSALVKRCVQYIAEKFQLKTMIYILLLITMVSSLVTLVPFQMLKFFQNPQSFVQFGQFC